MRLRIIDMLWLKKTWDWVKKNWKYVVTLGIPVLLSFIAGLLRSNRSLEKKVELEQDLRKIDNEAAAVEALSKEAARIEKEALIAAAEKTHDALIHQVKEDMAKRIKEIETAEQATEAIKNKLAED